jgi:hypothetical protein
VVAETTVGPARLAEFAVANRTDTAPPRLGRVAELGSVLRSALAGGGPKETGLVVDAVFDDTTPDDALRFEVFDHAGESKATLVSAVLAQRIASDPQASLLKLAEKAECGWGNFSFAKRAGPRDYRVRAVDLAGNASPQQKVDLAPKQALHEPGKPERRVDRPPLYHVPRLGVVSKTTVYRASGVAVSLLVLLGMWLAWRRRQ